MTISRNLSFLAEGVSSSGVLGATYGGTGQSTITTGDLLYGSASNTISKLAIGSTGTVLRVVGGVPSWGTDYTGTVTSVAATVPSFLSISGSPITSSGTLAITLSGTALPTTSGGTGLTSLTAGYIPYGNGTGAFSSSSNITTDGTTLTASRYISTSSNASLPSFGVASGNGIFNIGTNGIGFSVNSTQQMQIGATGGVSIGNTTDPGATNLSVTGNIRSGSLTSGRIPYASTSGLLIDSANLTFDGTNLGIGNTSPIYPLTIGSSSTRGVVDIIGTSAATPVLILNNTNAASGHQWNIYAGSSGAGNLDFTDLTAGLIRMTIDGSGKVGIGGIPFGNVGAFSVKGTASITDGSAQGTTTELVQTTSSITIAKTILTSVAPSLSSAAASYIYVYGSNNSTAYFFDVLVCIANAATVTVLSSTTLGGSPAARTYALVSGALTLTMASGTYNVTAKAMAIGYPF